MLLLQARCLKGVFMSFSLKALKFFTAAHSNTYYKAIEHEEDPGEIKKTVLSSWDLQCGRLSSVGVKFPLSWLGLLHLPEQHQVHFLTLAASIC